MLRIRRLFKLQTYFQQKPLYNLYIHLKDHNKKIVPKESRTALSYMNIKNKSIQQMPKQSEFVMTLRSRDQRKLERQIFEDYKQKILQAKIDEEEQEQVDSLWGQQKPPVHYYKNLSKKQASFLTFSNFQDAIDLKNELVDKFFYGQDLITSFDQVKNLNDLSKLALYYRKNGVEDRKMWHQIQKTIGTKFHLLTVDSLINLIYACNQSPKQCTPQFRKILRDLLIEQINNLTPQQLIFIFYANRFDKYRKIDENIQLKILDKLEPLYQKFSFEQKINWLLLFTDSRKSIVRNSAHDRFWNQKRDKGAKLIYQLNLITPQLSSQIEKTDAKTLKKIVYSLTRMRLIHVQPIVSLVTTKIEQLFKQNKLSNEELVFFFINFTQIQNGKGIQNIELLKELKEKILQNWENIDKINKLRVLWGMANMNIYDQSAHQLYRNIEMEADNTILGYFCRLQFLNSSEREWQIVHLMTELEELPISYFKDYKRFYNYLKATTDWNLSVIQDKLENTQCFMDAKRYQSSSLDKPIYKNLKQFLEFSQSKLPNKFEMGVPINNVQFVQFALPQYQISFDIATDIQCISGTKELKAEIKNKIKSLQSLGWKHLYLFESDLQYIKPVQFFNLIHHEIQQHIQSQLEVIQAAEAYRIYELELLRNDRFWKELQGEEVELWKNDPEKAEKLFSKQFEDKDPLEEEKKELDQFENQLEEDI